MERLTWRDAEGHARWRTELLEDDTGAAGELIRNTVAEYEDRLEAQENAETERRKENDHE